MDHGCRCHGSDVLVSAVGQRLLPSLPYPVLHQGFGQQFSVRPEGGASRKQRWSSRTVGDTSQAGTIYSSAEPSSSQPWLVRKFLAVENGEMEIPCSFLHGLGHLIPSVGEVSSTSSGHINIIVNIYIPTLAFRLLFCLPFVFCLLLSQTVVILIGISNHIDLIEMVATPQARPTCGLPQSQRDARLVLFELLVHWVSSKSLRGCEHWRSGSCCRRNWLNDGWNKGKCPAKMWENNLGCYWNVASTRTCNVFLVSSF